MADLMGGLSKTLLKLIETSPTYTGKVIRRTHNNKFVVRLNRNSVAARKYITDTVLVGDMVVVSKLGQFDYSITNLVPGSSATPTVRQVDE